MQQLPLMQSLPNNCRAGKFSVYPANWKTKQASILKPWRITYRFYDDNLNKSRKVVIKGMNDRQSARERQAVVWILIQEELELLQQGYNHITENFKKPQNDVSGQTPFLAALEYARDKIKISPASKIDMNSCLKYIFMAARALRYDFVPINQIRRKHIKVLLEETGKLKQATDVVVSVTKNIKKAGIWTANTFNQYRANLSMLFAELVEYDAIETNWCRDIKKQKGIKKIRPTLSLAERKMVNEHLLKKDVHFWRFLHIFFHSGCRITELLNVKTDDVQLNNQRYKILMKKGKSYQEEWRTIKDIAVPLWMDALENAKPNNFLFSEGLKPGARENPIRREQITRRWRRHVKIPLGIIADFYSLKHSNLDEVADMMDLKAASVMAGHKTPVITLLYTQGEEERNHQRLKKINNSFA